MEQFIGLDLSLSGTGFCRLDVNDRVPEFRVETIKSEKKKFEDDLVRLRFISDEVMRRIPKDANLVCVEDFFTPSNPYQIGAAIKLAMLAAIVRLGLKEAGIPFIIPTANQIKKFVTGKGQAQKNTVVMEVYKRWGLEAKDDNQADACGMAHLAKAIYDMQYCRDLSGLTQIQQKVAKTVLGDRPSYNCPWQRKMED